MPRTETQLGVATGATIAATYANLYTVPASTTVTVHLNVTNRTAASLNLRAYVADTTWASGEPTGSTLKAAIAYDMVVFPGEVAQIGGVVMLTTQKLVVWASATGLDVVASGVLLV